MSATTRRARPLPLPRWRVRCPAHVVGGRHPVAALDLALPGLSEAHVRRLAAIEAHRRSEPPPPPWRPFTAETLALVTAELVVNP